MEIKVQLNNLRVAPRKVRQVADVIRNKKAVQARALLEFTVKRASDPMLKLLNSAIDSALTNFKMEEANLYISKIVVNEGPKLKRSHPMSRGRAYPIMKRTSHITLILNEKNPLQIQKSKVKVQNENAKLKTKKRVKRES